MASYADTAARWLDIVLGRTDKSALRTDRMPVEGSGALARIYSYGRHFEMARLVTPRRGAPFFLLNGDRYSATTTGHQSHVRAVVGRSGVPFVIVPHTAMSRAGILLDTVELVTADDDKTVTTTHNVMVPEVRAMLHTAAARADGKLRDVRAAIIHALTERGDDWPHDAENIAAEYAANGYRYGVASGECAKMDNGTRYSVAVTLACHDYWTGAGGAYVNGYRVLGSPKVSWYRDGHGLDTPDMDTGAATYTTSRHFLGASVIRATVRDDVDTWTYSRADADASGGALGHRTGGHRAESWQVARGTDTRTAYFVSGFDTNENRPLYFLAELPTKLTDGRANRPATVTDALASLAPAPVLAAMADGLDVKRQGDIFAVPVPDGTVHAIAAKHAERGAAVTLDGTLRHSVSEMVTARNVSPPVVYARGIMRHTGGEHTRVHLGKTWHALYRNRVPMSEVERTIPGTGGTRYTRRTPSGDFGWRGMSPGAPAPRAWTLGGRVD